MLHATLLDLVAGLAKRTQHVVRNNVARCCTNMLHPFGQGFTLRSTLGAALLYLPQCCPSRVHHGLSLLSSEWRKEEVARIEELYSGPERKAALVGLLEQEAYLIASINRHKLVADKENKDKRVKGFLDKVRSRPGLAKDTADSNSLTSTSSPFIPKSAASPEILHHTV